MANLLHRLIRVISPAPWQTVSSREHSLDETIESSFPASDPLSTIPAPEPDVERTGYRNDRKDGQ